MNAEIKRAWSQWMVIPLDGQRGGIAVASKKAGERLCAERKWNVISIDRTPISRYIPKE